MPEMLPLNNGPLNQKAKEFLLQVKEPLDPSVLYALQLALWGIDKGGLAVPYQVEETLRQMVMWEPGPTMKALEQPNPHNPEETLHLENGPTTPLDLAWAVLDQLVSALSPRLGLTKQPIRD